MALTPRGSALRWLTNHRGITEQPAGSNTDNRKDGIRAAQILCAQGGTWLIGLPWCGVWAHAAAHAGGVRPVAPWRWASVAAIEDDARAHVNKLREWVPNQPGDARGRVLRGDLVVMFGRGVHVGVFREWIRDSAGRITHVVTDEGNTSSGDVGSQDNGGGAFRRVRPISAVYGFARVNFPG